MKKTTFSLLLLSISAISFAQNVAISPSRLYFKTAVGEYKTQEVNLTNSSTVKQSFTVSFSDFEPSGSAGKTTVMKSGESKNSCAEWLSANPSFFELEPGQTQKIQVLMQVPSSPEANAVKWSAMQVRLTKERQAADKNGDKSAIGLGVTETFQFVVHIFQTPPTVTNKSAEIESFGEVTSDNNGRILLLKVKNSGEAILDCASYIELTNVANGQEDRQKPIAFTLLPGCIREVKFPVPASLPEGKYSVLGVVDYGSRENVQAAETEIVLSAKK